MKAHAHSLNGLSSIRERLVHIRNRYLQTCQLSIKNRHRPQARLFKFSSPLSLLNSNFTLFFFFFVIILLSLFHFRLPTRRLERNRCHRVPGYAGPCNDDFSRTFQVHFVDNSLVFHALFQSLSRQKKENKKKYIGNKAPSRLCH